MFLGMENEPEMYHAAATVSTLLLKLGEVSRKFRTFSVSTNKAGALTTDEYPNNYSSPKSHTINMGAADEATTEHWSITFEQLIASLLTDNLMVSYFDQKFDLDQKLTEYKSQHA